MHNKDMIDEMNVLTIAKLFDRGLNVTTTTTGRANRAEGNAIRAMATIDAMQAEQRHYEFSFMTVRQDSVPTLLRGVIDLVFEEPDGWVIVDFYSPQVLAYAEQWEQLVDGKVKEAGLYFIDRQRYYFFSSN